MDDFKPEDELRPDPSDRRSGRVRRAGEFDNEPQFNVDDVDLDGDERRISRAGHRHDESDEYSSHESDDDSLEAGGRRNARGRGVASKSRVPVSRQHVMMGIGILVLLLLILGIGSALKSPSPATQTAAQTSGAEKTIDLSGAGGNASPNSAADNTVPQSNVVQSNVPQNNAPQSSVAQNQSGSQPIAGNNGTSQDVSLPPISSTPNEPQSQPVSGAQQRVEVQGDLNNALVPPQGQGEAQNNGLTLPTAAATVAAMTGRNSETRSVNASKEPVTRPERVSERTKAIIEPARKVPVQQKTAVVAKTEAAETTEPATKTVAPVKHETVKSAPPVTQSQPVAKESKAAPITAVTSAAAPVASSGNEINAIKNAASSNYTLQLSSSSNQANLNAWAKKENLQNYAVYQTVRNGQPWYVLVSGVYSSKDDAKRAVATLPADVQAKNPWAKPIHQVQSDLK